MMTQTGQVNSFKELGEHFLRFVQQSNATTNPWEVIDDRLDSFYGATIKFPVANTDASSSRYNKELAINNLKNKTNLTVGNFYSWLGSSTILTDSVRFSSFYVASSDQRVHEDQSNYPMSSNVYIARYYVGFSNQQDVVCIPVPNNKIIAIDSFNSSECKLSTYLSTLDSGSLNVVNTNMQADVIFINFSINPTLVFLCGKLSIFDYISDICNDIKDLVISNYGNNHIFCCRIFYTSSSYDIEFTSATDFNINRFNTSKALFRNFLASKLSDFFIKEEQRPISSYYVYKCYYEFTYNVSFPSAYPAPTIVPMKLFVGGSSYSIGVLGKDAVINSFMFNQDDVDFMTSSLGINTNEENYLYTSLSSANHVITWGQTIEYYPDKTVSRLSSIIGYEPSDDYDVETEKKGMYAYISLQYNKITPTTYNEWLTNTKDHYMSETFNSNRRRPIWYNNSLVYERTTISNQRQNDTANIFKNTGEVLFISPHIKYDKNLWMAEQGGIACDHETRNQFIEDNCLRAQHIRYPVSGGIPQLYWNKLPPFPSLGCPMFTIREDQLTATREVGEDAIQYYFVRTNTSASIVVYSRMVDSLNDRFGVQHMSFGALDCFSVSEQFMYPLYVAGGNGALDKEHWVYYLPTGGPPQHEVGNVYDLYMGNVSMSNSNLILSAKFNGSNTTNFRVLCPDGHWDNIFNVVQTCQLIVDPDECFPNPWTPRYYIYNEPVVGGSELGDNRFGGTTLEHGNNSIKKIDTHLIKRGYISSPSTRMVIEDITANSPITPIVPVFSSHKTVSPELWNRHRYGPIGKIPLCYSTWSRYLRFGELELNGKKFLAIPCTYEDKLWWLEARTKLDLVTLDKQWEKIMNINNKLYNYIIYDYLLLQLEE